MQLIAKVSQSYLQRIYQNSLCTAYCNSALINSDCIVHLSEIMILWRELLFRLSTLIILIALAASEETNNSTATKTNSSSNTSKSRQRSSKAFSVPSCPDSIKSKPEECYQYSIKNIEIDFNQLAKEVIDSSEVKKVAKDLLNQISPDDVITLFEKKVGMTLAEFVLLVIFLFSLPSLMIVGAVFICCWGCGCCCFSKKYHGVATTCHPNLGHYNSNGVFVPSNAATDPSVLTRRSRHEAVNQEAPAVDTLSRRGP